MRIFLVIFIGIIIFRMLFIFLEQKSLYYPEKEISGTPEDLGLVYEDVYFKTADGRTLNGWFTPVKGAKVTVLYCHGNAGNIYHRLHKVKFFHELEVNFFIYDYRGYGLSSGSPSEKGFYKDAQAAYDYLASRPDVDKDKIVVYGKSLGGPVAADLCLNRKAGALILEGTLASLAKRAQQIYPFLPMQLLLTQKYDTMAKLKNIHIPKLIAHGRQDEVIGFEHGEILFKSSAEPKDFLSFEGGHNDDIYIISPAYKAELQMFFKKAGMLTGYLP